MSNKSMRPTPGQGRIEGIEAKVHSPVSTMHQDMNARRAFGGLVTPEYWHVDPEEYQDITDEMVKLVAPSSLRSDLMGIERPKENQLVVDSIALSPAEYKLVPRNIGAIGRAVISTAQTGKLQLIPLEQRREKASSKRPEVLRNYMYKSIRYVNETLVPQNETLAFLTDMARTPGYSRGKHIDIHQKITLAKGDIFPSMLNVVGDQREWTNQQRELAGKALEKRLLLTGNERVRNWSNWLRFATQYNDAKQGVFKRRIKEIKEQLS